MELYYQFTLISVLKITIIYSNFVTLALAHLHQKTKRKSKNYFFWESIEPLSTLYFFKFIFQEIMSHTEAKINTEAKLS